METKETTSISPALPRSSQGSPSPRRRAEQAGTRIGAFSSCRRSRAFDTHEHMFLFVRKQAVTRAGLSVRVRHENSLGQRVRQRTSAAHGHTRRTVTAVVLKYDTEYYICIDLCQIFGCVPQMHRPCCWHAFGNGDESGR